MGSGAEPGEPDRIEVLYRSRYPAFVRVARGITRDEQAAHDVVHDVFATAAPCPFPLLSRGPHVIVTQVARPTPALRALGPLPPPGYARLEERRAVLRHAGLVVEIHASSRELSLAAARALRPFDG